MRKRLFKLLCAVLATAIMFAFAACGAKNDGDATASSESAALPAETDTAETTLDAFDESTTLLPDETSTQADVSEVATEAVTEAQDKAPSTKAEIVEYYNTAINRVKPKAKSITQNYELNTQVKPLDLSSLKILESLANSLVEKNMGYKSEASNRVMTSLADKNSFFVVEGKDWSSKLTAADVEKAAITEKDGVYTVTLNLVDSPASDSTAKGIGHAGRGLSVVEVDKIYENAGGAKSIIKNVKTGNPDGKIVVTIDKATGNVTHANFYMPWELCLTAMGVDVAVTFGIEQDYDIKW